MQRVFEGTQPVLTTSFYDHNNKAAIPTSIFYSVVRADTNQYLVSPTSVVPAQTIEVVLPTAATDLDPGDRNPVVVVYNLNVRFPLGNNYQEEVRFAVIPPTIAQ